MDWSVWVIAVAFGVALALVFLFVEGAFEKAIGWLFQLLDLESGKGPLAVRTAVDGEILTLTLENVGGGRLKLATVEGRNESQERLFPAVYLDKGEFRTLTVQAASRRFSEVVLGPSRSRTVLLDLAQLTDMDCRTLTILDANGRAWPVDEFPVDEFKAKHRRDS